MTKADLRREMRRRLQMPSPDRAEQSRAITEAIVAYPGFARSRVVALFSPLPGEPDVERLWKTIDREWCYPRVAGRELEFVSVASLENLAPSAWNRAIREPALRDARIVPPDEINLLLVPGLAFTRAGQRIGRGGGFYDRFLARLPASTVKMGVCFEEQIVETLPVEPHDQRMDAVVTERGLVVSG